MSRSPARVNIRPDKNESQTRPEFFFPFSGLPNRLSEFALGKRNYLQKELDSGGCLSVIYLGNPTTFNLLEQP